MSRLARDVAVNVVGQLALTGLGLVANALVYRRLGGDILGLYYFGLSVGAVAVTFIDGGLAMLIVRDTAAERLRDRARVTALHQTGSFLSWTGTLAAMVPLVLAAPLLAGRWVDLGKLPHGEASWCLAFFLAAAMLALPRSLYGAMLRGLQSFRAANLVAVGSNVLQLAGALAALLLHAPAAWFAAWYAISSGLSTAAAAATVASVEGVAPLRPRLDRAVLTAARGFLGWTIFTAGAAGLLTYCDRLVLAAFLPVEKLAFYATAGALVAKVRQLVASISQATLPALSQAHRDGDPATLGSRYRQVQDLILVGTLTGYAAVIFATRPLLGLVFDAGVAGEIVGPVALLAVSAIVSGALSTPYQISLVAGRPEIAARQNLFALPVVVGLTVLFTWLLGVLGAALGGVAYHVFAVAYAMPRYARLPAVEPTWIWIGRLLATLAIGAVSYGPGWWLTRDAGLAGWPWIALGFAIGTAVYAALAWPLLLRDETRAAARRFLRR